LAFVAMILMSLPRGFGNGSAEEHPIAYAKRVRGNKLLARGYPFAFAP